MSVDKVGIWRVHAPVNVVYLIFGVGRSSEFDEAIEGLDSLHNHSCYRLVAPEVRIPGYNLQIRNALLDPKVIVGTFAPICRPLATRTAVRAINHSYVEYLRVQK